MNAFTSSDWTAYPFATRNEKDYFGLLDVYLDAVFFPKLDPLSFAQEGHRFEYDGDILKIKWIVYNEMKWVYADHHQRIYEDIKMTLHPVTTYHHDSGGNPRDIPDLTYEDFKQFHAEHYHPTNATFMTFGNIAPERIQERFEERVLWEFSHGHKILPRDEKRLAAREEHIFHYPNQADAECYVHISVLLDRITETSKYLETSLVLSYLTDHAGSPLTQWLDEHPKVIAPSPLMGIDDSGREIRVTIGAIVANREDTESVKNDLEKFIEKLTSLQPTREEYQSLLDKLELRLLDRANGSSYPLGLEYMLTMIGHAMHDGDITASLDLSWATTKLSERVANPEFWSANIDRIWNNNAHYVINIHLPDPAMNERESQREQSYINQVETMLTLEEKNGIIEQSKKLKQLQETKESLDVLPTLTLEDIPSELKTEAPILLGETNLHIVIPTQWVDRLSSYTSIENVNELSSLSLVTSVLGELSTKNHNYTQFGEMIGKYTGGISHALHLRANEKQNNEFYGLWQTNTKYLSRYRDQIDEILGEMLHNTLVEDERLKVVLSDMSQWLDAQIIGSGQKFAMLESSALLSWYSALSGRTRSIQALKTLREYGEDDHFEQAKSEIQRWIEILSSKQFHSIEWMSKIEQEVQPFVWHIAIPPQPFSSTLSGEKKIAWLFESQISYHSRAYRWNTGERNLKDDATKMILAQYLRDCYLHTMIREQGWAYGGGANYDRDSGIFRTFSYRDPRLLATYESFQVGMEHIANETGDHSEALLGAKLGVLSSYDKISSPLLESQSLIRSMLLGQDLNERNILRSHLLEVTHWDLIVVARDLLSWESADASISGMIHREVFEQSGYSVKLWSEK